MPNSTTTHYFFSSLRRGALTQAAFSGPNERPELTLELTTEAKDRAGARWTEDRQFRVGIYGPGEMLGFDSRQTIAKVFPRGNDPACSANLVPYAEFNDPDILWRYSVDRAQNGSWYPWLTLVLLKAEDGEEFGEYREVGELADADLPPRIRLTEAAILPDLDQSWRWAHVHYPGRAGESTSHIGKRLRANPRLGNCRLLAARRLEAGKRYTAFVVPTYRAGIWAALGRSAPEGEPVSRKAWTASEPPPNRELPYYYRWSFRAGQIEDFEALVKMIRPTNLDRFTGPEIDTSQPGYRLGDLPESQRMATALVPLAGDSEVFPSSGQLAELLNRGEAIGRGDDPAADPEVTPPIYGRWYATGRQERVRLEDSVVAEQWLEQLNLDLRYRLVAAQGVAFVQQNQEALLEEAWSQYQVIKAVNQRLNRGRFGRALAGCLYKRLQKIDRNEHLVQLTGGVLAEVSVSGGTSAAELIRHSAIPNSAANGRIQRFQRKLNKGGEAPGDFIPSRIDIVRPTFAAGGTIWTDYFTIFINSVAAPSELVTAGQELGSGLDPQRTIEGPLADQVRALRDWSQVQQPGPTVSSAVYTPPKDTLRPVKWYPEFHRALYAHLRDSAPEMILPGLAEMPRNSVALCRVNRAFVEAFLVGANHEFAAELRWREFPTDLQGSYFRNFWDTAVQSVGRAEREAFRRSTWGEKLLQLLQTEPFRPLFPASWTVDEVWNKLIEIVGESALSEPELAVYEQYELAIERWLLTREENKDIAPLHTWPRATDLGSHPISATNATGTPLVLLMRATLFERFPNLLIYLVPKDDDSFSEATRVYPSLAGELPPDIEFVGFDGVDPEEYAIVFEERPGEPRFGLDVTVANNPENPEAAAADDLTWEHFGVAPGAYLDAAEPAAPAVAGQWNNAAYIAKTTLQKPFRLAIELNRFATQLTTLQH